MTRFGKTIRWSVLSVVGAFATLAPAPGGPRGPKLHTGANDEAHGDNLQGDRDNKFDGLQHRISIFRDWLRNHRFW